MNSFLFDRVNDTLRETNETRIPIYSSLNNLNADVSNLENNDFAITENALYKIENNIPVLYVGGSSSKSLPAGVILPFGSDTIPNGYLLCDGRAVSRNDYPDLFNVIGVVYGQGDGSTTFNLPDLREVALKGWGKTSKSTIHYSSSDLVIGQYIEDRIKSHTHTTFFPNTSGTLNLVAGGSTPDAINRATTYTSGDADVSSGITNEVKAVTVNYIIKV